MQRATAFLAIFAAWVLFPAAATAQGAFVNFETPTISPIAISPDGTRLAVCNLPDAYLDVYDLTVDPPVRVQAIPVGIDPVSVRFRTDAEAWVVNHISDSVSVVDLVRGAVVHTLETEDEPADVVFAGEPERAFVSCQQTNRILVFDPANLTAPPVRITIRGEKPRMLAVSPDGATVYAALFESGNSTTILGGGAEDFNLINFPPNVVSNPLGPYRGQNPPPNVLDGARGFDPPLRAGLPTPPRVGLIVRQGADGAWRDDNGADWTAFVSGPQAALSGRPIGWRLLQNDVAVIDADTLAVTYRERLMNINMALAVNPATGEVHVVGTEATNEIRFEPNLEGTFVRVHHARANAGTVSDLNPHLDYTVPNIPWDERVRSIGDPRAIVWTADGTRAFVAGMGSNNVIGLDADGNRVPLPGTVNGTIPVGEGPAGLALDEARDRLIVFNRFEMSLSLIALDTHAEIARIPLHDSTPEEIRAGRPHLYNTHHTSGLGQASCAACHVDARKDRLAWDLGDPTQGMRGIPQVSLTNPGSNQVNRGAGVPGLDSGMQPFHPMKGPMTTQTLQDIIGLEPHHWRGDRSGIEQFNGTFTALHGADAGLTPAQMAEFKAFLGTIYYPPNPFRNPDNSLPTDLPLEGQYATGKFQLAAGTPLPNGNAQRALDRYRDFDRPLDRGVFSCVLCHSVPTGAGTNSFLVGGTFQEIPLGPMDEAHLALVGVDGSTNRSMKVAHLRNMYDKTGFDLTQPENTAGFGFLHDGSIDSLARFMSEPAFEFRNDQEIADMVALMLAFAGSEFGAPSSPLEPPGVPSQDVHAGVGAQHTIASGKAGSGFVALFAGEAQRGMVDLIATTTGLDGLPRGYLYLPDEDAWLPDSLAEEPLPRAELLAKASGDAPITFTVTPHGSGFRLAIDRNGDGLSNYDTIRDWNPVLEGVQNPFDLTDPDVSGDNGSREPDGIPDALNDFNGNGIPNAEWIAQGGNPLQSRPEDVTFSGDVTAVDVQFVINAALGLDIAPVNADVNNDNAVDAVDVQLVINAALGVS